MEKHGKNIFMLSHRKVMEIWRKNKVMEIQKGHRKVMEFLHCL